MKFGYDNTTFRYYCSNCSSVLKETRSQIDISCINEECRYCGELLQQTLEKRKDESKSNSKIKFKQQFQIAINSQLRIDTPSLKIFMPYVYFGDKICIIDNSHSFVSEFLPRFKVMSISQGISPIVFADAGNCANPYRWTYYARQYGIDIDKALDSVLVSRMFTIYQLQSTISDIEKTLERYNSKVLIISDILKLFADVKEREGERVLKEIIYSLARINDIILLVTVSRIPSENLYKLLLPLFNKQIVTFSQKDCFSVKLIEGKCKAFIDKEIKIPIEEILLVDKI